jgi:hypothetical protein
MKMIGLHPSVIPSLWFSTAPLSASFPSSRPLSLVCQSRKDILDVYPRLAPSAAIILYKRGCTERFVYQLFGAEPVLKITAMLCAALLIQFIGLVGDLLIADRSI